MINLISKEEKDRIDEICKKYNIENYSINPDGSIDVDDDYVSIINSGLEKLPLKFGNVSGSFNCDSNRLSTLQGAPQSVGGGFYCDGNKLTSLDEAPQSVGGKFSCFNNRITTLEGGPITVGGGFYCSKNKLTNLVGAPEYIGGSFKCRENKMTSTYSGDIDIEVTGETFLGQNKLTQSLKDNIVHIKLILKYQRHFEIWNDDLTLNEENFQVLLDEIKDGLE